MYNAWLNRLRAKVLSNWDYPPGKFHVVLQAVVSADGSVGDMNLKSTPHGDAAEKAASAAFSQAQPLEPLPSKAGASVRVTMNFDSTYDPHGDSSSGLSCQLNPLPPPKADTAAAGKESAPKADQDQPSTPHSDKPAEEAGGNTEP